MKASKLSIITIIILLGLLFIERAFCQENFQPGFILNLKGDTITGLIDYRNWVQNPETISFRESEKSGIITYNPLTIKGFKVNNEIFFGAIVEAEGSPYNTEWLNTNPEINRRIDTIFIQAMILGSKNLFLYTDKNGKEQFYVKQWPDFEMLVYKKYLKLNEPLQNDFEPSLPAKILKENKNYLGQLMLYLQDCPSIQPMVNKTKFQKSSLIKLFETYAKCTKSAAKQENNEYTYKFSKEKVKFQFSVIAGCSVTKLILNSSDATGLRYLANVDYTGSLNMSGGLALNIVLPRNQGKYSIYNEIHLTSFTTGAHFEEYHHENYYVLIDTKIGFTYLKLNSMLRYKFIVKNDLFIFANAGISYGQPMMETNSIFKNEVLYDQNTVTEKQLMKTKNYEIGYLGGIGTGYKKYSFEARYERGDGMSAYANMISITNRFYFLLSYRF